MENDLSNDPKSDEGYQANGFSHKQFLAPIKIFKCKYCARKFLNSRALGGHQNAHKKEKTLWMLGLHHHNKPLRMEPHHTSIQEESMIEKSKESFNMFQEADQDLMNWPGSFQIHSTDSNEASSNGEALELVLNSQKQGQSRLKICELDLDLHL